ncbi:hypothetical protein VNO80_26068 [Phaseolus coccineus]|uniref:Uncharacterized protein n=1 Tax=Phaseolus coccineus TaxID=3886 RepID=A0AAN9LVB9_PHACN
MSPPRPAPQQPPTTHPLITASQQCQRNHKTQAKNLHHRSKNGSDNWAFNFPHLSCSQIETQALPFPRQSSCFP